MPTARRAAFALACVLASHDAWAQSAVPAPSSTSSSTPSPAPAPTDAPEEVRVHGARREPGETSLSADEVRQVPGAFGDAFRAMEALPGVTPIQSGLPFFFVRGAPPGNTGYYLDGVRVPLLYHVGFGPSVIQPGMLERVDFFPGGAPARFGRFAGGILSGETRAPATEAHAEGNVRLFDAGGFVETPFDGGRGTVLAGGRYSYTALALSLFAPNTQLSYGDYQGRATWALSDRDRVGVFAFGSLDSFGELNGHTYANPLLGTTEFHRVDLRYDHAIGTTGSARLALTLGADSTEQGGSTADDKLIGLRLEAENKLDDGLRVRGGADVMVDRYTLGGSYSQLEYALGVPFQVYNAPRNDVVMGAYGDVVWRPSARVEIVPGLRADVYTSRRGSEVPSTFPRLPAPNATAVPTLEPRVATRVRVTPAATWVSAFGVAHQTPSFLVPVPGLQTGDLQQGLQTSLQLSQGVEVSLPLAVTATATVFYQDYLGLSDVQAACIEVNPQSACAADRTNGRAFGLELFVRRSLTKRFTGWLSYTLSRSTIEIGRYRSYGLDEIPSSFDRTHVLSAIAAYDLGHGFRAGARFFFYTGFPYSNVYEGVAVPPYNEHRLPAYYRLDVRLEKGWRVGKTGRIAVVLEGLNVTFQQEASGLSCASALPRGGLPGVPPPGAPLDRCTPTEVGPVTIPSLGVEGSI